MYLWCSLLAAIVLAWLGHRAYVAKRNLVTLDVRNADVRDVARKIGWQTWETILVDKDVKGKITLHVVKRPLEEVLEIISEQTSSRAMAVYPIYSKSASFVNLRKLARGEATHEAVGWTNFFTGFGRDGGRRGGGGPGGFGGFGGGPGGFGGPGGPGGPEGIRPQDAPVSLNVPGKDLAFATIALSKFSQAQVISEDGATATITLQLSQVPFTKAVAQVAKQAKRKWDVFYTLQGRPDFFARDSDDDGPRRGDREGFGRRFRGDGETNRFDTNRWAELREQREALREREVETRLATMTPEEKQKTEEQQQKMEEIRNLPPEQRQQAFEQLANDPRMAENRARFEQRANNSFKYATPDQRVDRARRTAERKLRQESGQQGRR